MVKPPVGHTTQGLLSLIREIFVLLWQISSQLAWLKRAAEPSGPPAFDDRVLRGLRPATVVAYRKSYDKFFKWLADNDHEPFFPQEYDRLLAQFAVEANLSRSLFERSVSAVEKMVPGCHRNLTFSRQLMANWRRALPSKHTTPMPHTGAIVCGWHAAALGEARAGALLILQILFGLRPSELPRKSFGSG